MPLLLIMALLSVPQDPTELTIHQVIEAPLTKQGLIDLATSAAHQYQLDADRFVATMKCEIKKRADGSWDYTAQSDHVKKDGTRENSWGAWQINLDAHPTITKEMAQDPYWATNWAANEWKKGRAWQWSCYK